MRTKEYQLVGMYFKHRYVPPSKAKKLVLNKDLIMNVYTDNYFSNGYYSVEFKSAGLERKVLNTPSEKYDEYNKILLTTTFEDYNISESDYTKVEISGYIIDSENALIPKIKPGKDKQAEILFISLEGKKKNIFYNKEYIDSVLKLHPSSEMYLRTKDINSKVYDKSILVFKDKNEIVGLVAPILTDNTKLKIVKS
jgi:hypothetical protein